MSGCVVSGAEPGFEAGVDGPARRDARTGTAPVFGGAAVTGTYTGGTIPPGRGPGLLNGAGTGNGVENGARLKAAECDDDADSGESTVANTGGGNHNRSPQWGIDTDRTCRTSTMTSAGTCGEAGLGRVCSTVTLDKLLGQIAFDAHNGFCIVSDHSLGSRYSQNAGQEDNTYAEDELHLVEEK